MSWEEYLGSELLYIDHCHRGKLSTILGHKEHIEKENIGYRAILWWSNLSQDHEGG